jgi:KDO II ethanolaminephosphotransferase
MLYTSSIATKNLLYSPKEDRFRPYIIEKIDKKEQNVIIVMGESLSYKRMHLFGYDKSNTPNLDRLRNNRNFFYTKAISCGVNTPVSIVSFFNLKREPTNRDILIKQDSNLLRLAKTSGYNTAWFSMQDEGMSISSVLKFASTIKVRKDYPNKSYDDELLKDLKKIDWSRDNFIILHLRANHSPYERYIPSKFRVSNYNRLDYNKYKVNSYNDSILYIDYLLDRIFKYMSSTKSNFRLYFTSDHGERLGYSDDNFKYGHSELDFEVSKVPLLIYSNRRVDVKKEITNHYKIGKMVLRDIGYRVYNQNDDNSSYFINGLNRDGKAGFLKYNIP